jgi:beta-lactam-binding protein with PASTA domain
MVPMKAFFRLALLALILVTVALVSALTAMRLAIHGREVAVPKLEGLTPAEAERAAAGPGLLVEVERQFYSASVPEGRILSQVPQAGTRVRRGWRVRVAESLGRQRVAIPDVLGQSARVAQITISRRGLELGSVAQLPLPNPQPDQVIGQNPSPNASGVAAPRINLLVALPEAPLAYVMPNLIGQPLGSATQALQGAGMKLGTVSVTEPPVDPANSATAPPASPAAWPGSLIVSQNPVPGQKVTAGSVVNFEVGR